MRIMNVDGRLTLVVPDGVVDVATASGGEFAPGVEPVYAHWDQFRAWADGYAGGPTGPAPAGRIGPPVPRPPQVFAIGLNYRSHATETGAELPASPMVFTKFPASVTGPYDDVALPDGSVDFEAELVAVIGREARHVTESAAWSYVAGLTAGQDLSEREMQVAPPVPQQFSLAKSFAGFTPIGPQLVTPDEFPDPDDLEIGCTLSGEQMQKARTSDLIFSIPQVIAHLSAVLPLLPGDLIFTGTPSGIGMTRNPRRFLRPGDELLTSAEGIGQMRHHFIPAPRR